MKGTLVPITLANGRQGQLFIPLKQTDDPNTVYVRDEQGLHPVQLKDQVSRDEVVRAPAIVVDEAGGFSARRNGRGRRKR